MKKLFSILAVILLLAALSISVCAAEVNTLVYTLGGWSDPPVYITIGDCEFLLN